MSAIISVRLCLQVNCSVESAARTEVDSHQTTESVRISTLYVYVLLLMVLGLRGLNIEEEVGGLSLYINVPFCGH
jgi:hypothetical protein